MLRLVARLTARARLPVRFSRGYNPRPALSLAWPRPVGVATLCDLLVMTLDEPPEGRPPDAAELVSRLGETAPEGLRFLRAEPLAGRSAPLPRRMDYERPLAKETADRLRRRLAELAARDRWPARRQARPGKARAGEEGEFDIRPLVNDVRVEETTLRWSHVPGGGKWARPGELLNLLGLCEQADLSAVTRTGVEYGQ